MRRKGTAIVIALTAGLSAPANAGAISNEVNTTFDPTVQGFKFVNDFPPPLVVDLPDIRVSPFGKIPIGKVTLTKDKFGLCGGMSAAAADNFNSNTPAPADTAVPAKGTKTYEYLLERQIESLRDNGANGLIKFIDWSLRSDDDKRAPITKTRIRDGVKRLTREQHKKIVKRLEDGKVVPIGFVRTKTSNPATAVKKLTTGHQVLAIGSLTNDGGDPVLKVYDPNYPGKPTYLNRKDRRVTSDPNGSDVLSKFRGYFRMPYDAESPEYGP